MTDSSIVEIVVNKINENKWLISKHLLVSFCCASSEFVIFYVLSQSSLNWHVYVNFVISFCCATVLGFLLHTTYTFKVADGFKKRIKYFFVQAAVVLVLGVLMFKVLILFLLDIYSAKIIQMATTFSINVLVGKKITFRKDFK